jgi:hypothetical protein
VPALEHEHEHEHAHAHAQAHEQAGVVCRPQPPAPPRSAQLTWA